VSDRELRAGLAAAIGNLAQSGDARWAPLHMLDWIACADALDRELFAVGVELRERQGDEEHLELTGTSAHVLAEVKRLEGEGWIVESRVGNEQHATAQARLIRYPEDTT